MASSIGYYKYKTTAPADGETKEVKFYFNGILEKTCTVIGRNFCTDFRLVKYLDRSGQFRFYPFNDKWQAQDRPQAIGDRTNFVTSLIDGQGDSRQMGYKNTSTISLSAYSVSAAELDKLADMYVAPIAYLYIGDGSSDLEKDWLLVKISGNAINRRRKANFGNINITITLPENYAITEI